MVEVTKEVFYKVMGPLDVHPYPRKIDGVWGSDWKMRQSWGVDSKIIGRTTSDYVGSTVKWEINASLVPATGGGEAAIPHPETNDAVF